MTVIRDEAIWKAVKGEKMDLAAADKKTTPLPAVKTNYNPEKKWQPEIPLWQGCPGQI